VRIRFFPDQSDPLATAVQLIERAYRSGRRVAVRIEPQLAPLLGRKLWEERPGVFLPNVMADDSLAAATPILLCLPEQQAPDERPVWVNLARSLPETLPSCEWWFEVVGTGEADKGPARARYRRYKALGYLVDVAKGGGT